jgi:4-hydroxy-tetrahydrodipicolinate synthase
VLCARGAIGSAYIRKPGRGLSAADIAEVQRLIARQSRRLQEQG